MSRHSFDPEVASQVGINAAVIYQNIVWWCEKNAANGRHFYEGRYWTYNSVKAFADMFPYLSAEQIRRALERLVESGYIGTGNFNQSAYDRTKWFCDLRQVHLASTPNGNGEDAKPIPDSKPVEKPDGKPIGDFEAFWAEVPKKVGKGAARAAYLKAMKKADAATILAAMRAYAAEREGKDAQFTVHPATWLNQERWTDERAASPQEFYAQIDAMLRGKDDDIRRTDAIDSRARQPLLVGMEAPRTPDERNCDGASSRDSGGYQQEVASFLKPRRIGGSVF